MKARKGKGLFVFCCLAPAAILFIVFMILPTIDIFRMSMFKWGGYTDNKTFVGLQNFKILFKSDKFYQAFQNSILLIVLVTLVTFTFALVFAYILSREKIKGKTFFSVIFYHPEYFVSRSYQCDLLSNLRSESRTAELLPESVQRSGKSDPLARRSEDCYLQYCDRACMAGNRILHGYVYGKYGECAGKPL